jgi:hypothetical protein
MKYTTIKECEDKLKELVKDKKYQEELLKELIADIKATSLLEGALKVQLALLKEKQFKK